MAEYDRRKTQADTAEANARFTLAMAAQRTAELDQREAELSNRERDFQATITKMKIYF